MTEKELHTKIKNAGWANRFLGIFIGVIGVLIVVGSLISQMWLYLLIAIPIGGVAFIIVKNAQILYKKECTIEEAKKHLKAIRNISFLLLLGGGYGGLLLLISLAYSMGALSAIKNFSSLKKD